MKEKIHSAGGLANLKRLIWERKDELAVLIGHCKGDDFVSHGNANVPVTVPVFFVFFRIALFNVGKISSPRQGGQLLQG